jgi:AIR synthase-related protein
VRAACASAESRGVLRFEATVQEQNGVLFDRLGWERFGVSLVAGVPHLSMRWPIDRVQRLVDRTKSYLAPLLGAGAGLGRGAELGRGAGEGFVGDDGSPIAGTDVIVATDAILPAMVERDPEWAGWCSVLVNVNDLSAMGASPVGIMDALGARDEASARLIMTGLQKASEAWGVPIIGGHTQLGVPASLAVTAIGRTSQPVRGGGGHAGQALTVTADLGGSWRPGYTGTQWDSTSMRTGVELQQLARRVADARPSAAKDVSMSGLVGTVGMLAEASGCGAELDIAAIPRPAAVGNDAATMGDWLTCFPGFAMITADDPGASRMAGPITTSSECGRLTDAAGVTLRWPDGITTTAITGGVTGLGAAGQLFTDKKPSTEGTRS